MRQDAPLRCMAESQDGAWWAICIDLDIGVQGQSFADVKEGLNRAIEMYLERAAELPEAEQDVLLSRRSPWHVRAKFYLGSLLGWFGERDTDRRRRFELPAHA